MSIEKDLQVGVDVNSVQQGGDHYKSEYQHWDFVEDHNIPYLEAQILRYVMRAYKKNGVDDVRKALHCAHKIKERCRLGELKFRVYHVQRSALRLFSSANRLDPAQYGIFEAVCINWPRGNQGEVSADHVIQRIEEFLLQLLAPEQA
jgi:hypothetical protein